MKRSYNAIVMAFIVAVLFACGGPLQPPQDFRNSTGEGGGTSGPLAIPGGSGRTTDDLDFSYNADTEKHGMRIVNISGSVVPSEDEITTPKTLGLWEDGKFHIEGFNTNFNGGFQNAGFNEVSVLYYDQAFEGEFKFSARVKVSRAGGVSTGKGVHFGAYSNMGRTDAEGEIMWQHGQGSKGVGMFLRAESPPQFRLYYSDGGYNSEGLPLGNSTTAGTGAFGNFGSLLTNLKVNKEYIYEFARVKADPSEEYSIENAKYTYKLFDSKTGEEVFNSVNARTSATAWGDKSLLLNSTDHPFGTPVQMHDSLKRSVYPGVCISGSSLEVSQIKIWDYNAAWDYTTNTGDIGSVVFATPDTIPAYVPAQSYESVVTSPRSLSPVGVTGNPHPNPTIFFNAVQLAALHSDSNSLITIIPTVNPAWAEDTILFEFFYLGVTEEGMYNAFSIAGDTATLVTVPGVDKATYSKGLITVESAGMVGGERSVGLFKIVARDLMLDVDPGMDAPDYSLLQTLPEYYFRVQITK